MKERRYNEQEHNILKEHYAVSRINVVLQKLKEAGYIRTEGSVRTYAFRNGLARKPKSKYEKAAKRKNYYRIKAQQQWQHIN